MYLTAGGEERECPLAVLDARDVAAGQPARMPPSYAGQRNYPGLFWSTTMSGHLVYEGLLELSWLWLSDFDPDGVAIAAQPFMLIGADGEHQRTRFPDFSHFLSPACQGCPVRDVGAWSNACRRRREPK